jgi:hypothetical protein
VYDPPYAYKACVGRSMLDCKAFATLDPSCKWAVSWLRIVDSEAPCSSFMPSVVSVEPLPRSGPEFVFWDTSQKRNSFPALDDDGDTSDDPLIGSDGSDDSLSDSDHDEPGDEHEYDKDPTPIFIQACFRLRVLFQTFCV